MEKAAKAEKSGKEKLNEAEVDGGNPVFKAWHVALLALIAAVFIFTVHFIMLYLNNVYPFSDRVMSQYDLLAQIVPFAEHFFDVINGDASLFYSWRVGGGMDVFGTVAYCLISPFTFIFWLFGEGNAWQAASVMVPLKMACMALTSLIMIKMCFPRMKKPVALVVAILYSYCGYVFVSNTYINWMDFLIYIPLAVPAFFRLVKKGKVAPFAVVIALCNYTCFSISCFSMLVSYPALVVYAFMVVEKGDRKRYLTKLSLGYMCGVIAALPLFIPALTAYISSGRNTGIFDSLWDDIWEVSYARKLSYILSDTLFVVLIAVYFIKERFHSKLSRYAAVAGAMVMMPVLVDECCILMNMGSYLSYALRFGFLNAIYELVIACAVLEKFTFSRKAKNFERQLNAGTFAANAGSAAGAATTVEKGNWCPTMAKVPTSHAVKDGTSRQKMLTYSFPVCASVVFVAFCLFGIIVMYRLSEGYSDSASSFAHSTGAIEFILQTFVAVGIISAVAAILYALRLVNPKIIYTAMAMLLAAQVAVYGGYLVSGNVFNTVRYQQYNALYAQIMETEELEPYEFRVKDYGAYISDNQPLYTNSNSYSAFSSMTDGDNFAFNKVFGMGSNGVNTIKSRGGNLLGNCLIGNKYYFYNSEGSESTRPTLTFDFLEEVGRDTYFIMYKNTLVFPSAFTVSSGDMGVVEDYDYYFSNMQNLYNFLGGEGSAFIEYELTKSDVVQTTADDGKVTVYQVKMHLPVSGDYTFAPAFPEGYDVQWYTGDYSATGLSGMEEIRTFTYINSAPNSYYSIYLVGDGLTAEDILNYCTYKVIAKDAVADLSQSLWQRCVKYTMDSTLTKTTITANVTAESDGEYLFINYVALDGHTAYVNGKKVTLTENGLDMLLVPLEQGENEVVIEYSSPYIAYSGVGVAAAAVLFALIALLFNERSKRKIYVKLQTPIAVLSVVLAGAVVAFFMAFPTVVFIIKLVKLIL